MPGATSTGREVDFGHYTRIDYIANRLKLGA